MSTEKMLKKITDEEFNNSSISSLATRPNAPTNFGVGGLTSSDLRKRFDGLPALLKEKINTIIDAFGSGAAANELYVTLAGKNCTLADLVGMISTGELAWRIKASASESMQDAVDLQTIQSILWAINKSLTEKLEHKVLAWDIDGTTLINEAGKKDGTYTRTAMAPDRFAVQKVIPGASEPTACAEMTEHGMSTVKDGTTALFLADGIQFETKTADGKIVKTRLSFPGHDKDDVFASETKCKEITNDLITTHVTPKSYIDNADIKDISITPSGTGTDGKYKFTLTKGDGKTISADIDLPLETIKVAKIDDYVTEDGRRMLKVTYDDDNELDFELDDLFKGIIKEDDVKEIVATETEGKVDKIEPPVFEQEYLYSTRWVRGENDDFTEVVNELKPVDQQSVPNSVVVRNADGTLNVKAGTAKGNAVNLQQLEEYAMPIPTSLYQDGQGDGYIPVLNADGKTTTRKFVSGAYIGSFTVPYRMANGEVCVGMPSGDTHATPKKYVDDATAPIAENTKRIENLESNLLTFIEDTENAYEKDVPAGVGKNAILSFIGGASASKNLLDPNVIYEADSYLISVNDNGSVNFSYDFGKDDYRFNVAPSIKLPLGKYYLKKSLVEPKNDSTYGSVSFENGSNFVEVTDEENSLVNIDITIAGTGYCSADYYVMLSTDPDAEFESFFDGTNYAAVTTVVSYNSSLIDDAAIFKELGWVKQPNGYWLGSEANKLIFENTEQIRGSLTISYTGKTLTADGSNNSVFTMYIRYTDNTEEFKCNISDKSLDYAIRQYTTPSNKTVSKISIASGIPGTFDIKDLRIDWGIDIGERVIDTFEIPSEIQAINGYGKRGFELDLESKTTEYEGKITDVSAYLNSYDKFKMIEVEGGGRVEFVNEHGLAVPSEITYVKAKE